MKNRKNAVGRACLFIVFVFSCYSCHEDPKLRKDVQLPVGVNNAAIPAYPWTWETGGVGVDFMPSPAGTQILTPWANGAQILYDPAVRYDIRAADGWKLEYNNFSTSSIPSPGFFALYNQYRGILRFYWYFPAGNVPSGSTSTEEYVNFQGGSTTSFFNFCNGDVSDPGNNTGSVDKLTYYGVPANGNNWYMSQYEVAYDYNLPNLSYTNIGLYFTQPFRNITSQTLSGPITGTAKGTISSPSGGLGSIAQIVAGGAQVIGTFFDPTKLTGTLGTIVQGLVPDGAGGIVTGLGSIASELTGGGDQQVDLNVTLWATLTGNSTATGYLTQNLAIGMPGTADATSAPGYDPIDNVPLGIFNLPVRPIINLTVTNGTGQMCAGEPNGYQKFKGTLDASSLAYLNSSNSTSFNQALLNADAAHGGATIGTIYYDILGPEIKNLNCTGEASEYLDGIELTPLWKTSEKGYFGQYSPNSFALRVHFDVIPKNGANKVTIVKTFRANIVENF
jgi:hypothetical protein